MQSAKNIQAKIFGGGANGDANQNQNGNRSSPPQSNADGSSNPGSGSGEAPSLQIKIPPVNTSKFPKDKEPEPELKKIARRSGSTTNLNSSEPYESYQKRMLKKLGTKYDGVERYRLEQDEHRERHWKRWGPYVSERQWATCREDYSANGDAWSAFPHYQARSRAYRWGEDGIAGISDNHGRLCFALAMWNEKDPILKERLFGCTGPEGNHGEDCKEIYYYLDSTPTHSYMKYLYKYPQAEYPYDQLIKESTSRSREEEEYELVDTGLFNENRYWDVNVEYAKEEDDPESMFIRITAYNRGPDAATLHLLPTIWFPNTWSWDLPAPQKPTLTGHNENIIVAEHKELGRRNLYCMPSPLPLAPDADVDAGVDAGVDEEDDSVFPELLFTENETNFRRLYNGTNSSKYTKDAFHDHLIPSHRPKESDGFRRHVSHVEHSDDEGDVEQGPRTPFPTEGQYVNPEKKGTKAAAHYKFENVPGNGGCAVIRLKLTPRKPKEDETITNEEIFDDRLEERRKECTEFYDDLAGPGITDDLKQVMRQALGGMMWSKQFYQFIHEPWSKGDLAQPPPPPERKHVRNKDWKHLHIADVLSMPDKWEYPFFAAWDTAFHCIPLAIVDPAFAKNQLALLMREWYMAPNGQIPAYEWNFSDVNPPVHAWAAFRVFKMERKYYGREDLDFLESVFQKLLLNFTWWVNRKDEKGQNIFEGGFLGLDNIGAFNRSEPLPTGGQLRQADGTAWMAFYSLCMLNIALELAKTRSVYQDIASKFYEHFLFIADAMTFKGSNDEDLSLWDDDEGFYFDAISFGGGNSMKLPVRSLVGLIPLFATMTLEPGPIQKQPQFKKRMDWFIDHRAGIAERNTASMGVPGKGDRILLALANKDRLVKILRRLLDENEFLSEYGIRSLSKSHLDQPWGMHVHGQEYKVEYWPGDSKSGMFGGNSNWRGPVWLAVNFLLIESLQRFHQYYGDDLQVECPTGSGDFMNLAHVAEEIQHRLIHIFGRDPEGRRACNGGVDKFDHDPHFKDYIFFHEFFHADNGKGLGASHQNGWTGLVAFMIMQSGITCRLPKTPKTPRSLAKHYFDESIETRSEYGDDSAFPQTPYGDISPDAL